MNFLISLLDASMAPSIFGRYGAKLWCETLNCVQRASILPLLRFLALSAIMYWCKSYRKWDCFWQIKPFVTLQSQYEAASIHLVKQSIATRINQCPFDEDWSYLLLLYPISRRVTCFMLYNDCLAGLISIYLTEVPFFDMFETMSFYRQLVILLP